MAVFVSPKKRLLTILDLLPDTMLNEVLTFTEYLQYKQNHAVQSTPFQPIALGGLWKDISISDEDIAQMREEMWSSFGEINS